MSSMYGTGSGFIRNRIKFGLAIKNKFINYQRRAPKDVSRDMISLNQISWKYKYATQILRRTKIGCCMMGIEHWVFYRDT